MYTTRPVRVNPWPPCGRASCGAAALGCGFRGFGFCCRTVCFLRFSLRASASSFALRLKVLGFAFPYHLPRNSACIFLKRKERRAEFQVHATTPRQRGGSLL